MTVNKIWNNAIRDPHVWYTVAFLDRAGNTNDAIITRILDLFSATKGIIN